MATASLILMWAAGRWPRPSKRSVSIRTDPIALGLKGLALEPISTDQLSGPYYQQLMARVYLMVGEPEKGLDMLEPPLKMPYYVSPAWLRVDPTFAGLKGNPRYERLLK